ncbi:MAG: EAL domain-containing protein [Gammaproteobacteria bacterium]|nr:EAL domain-containing protein [Gammaproteobacteria bacterium]
MYERIASSIASRTTVLYSVLALVAFVFSAVVAIYFSRIQLEVQAVEYFLQFEDAIAIAADTSNDGELEKLLGSISRYPTVVGVELDHRGDLLHWLKPVVTSSCDNVLYHNVHNRADLVLGVCLDEQGVYRTAGFAALVLFIGLAGLMAIGNRILNGWLNQWLTLPLQAWLRRHRSLLPKTGATNDFKAFVQGSMHALSLTVRQKQLAERTIDTLDQAILLTDESYLIRRCNPAAVRLFAGDSASAKDLLGRDIRSLGRIGESLVELILEAVRRYDRLNFPPLHTDLVRLTPKMAVRGWLSPLKSDSGDAAGFVVTFLDLTEYFNVNQELQRVANMDVLTDIPNRRAFEVELALAFESATSDGEAHTLMLLDIDGLKIVNDTLGHATGDDMLRKIALRLRHALDDYHFLARIGGDEFAIILRNTAIKPATRLAHRLLRKLNETSYRVGKHDIQMTLRMGLREVNQHTISTSDVLAEADFATSSAHEQGGARVVVFEDIMSKRDIKRNIFDWRNHLDSAIERGKVQIYCQPIVHSSDARTHSLELLARMLMDNGSLATPVNFIDAAERFGHVRRLDMLMLEQLLTVIDQLPLGYQLNLNLSGETVSSPVSIAHIIQKLQKWGGNPERICFEVTESSAVRNLALASQHLHRLKDAGCTIALDDFGVGLSSLQHLRTLPIDILKIDGAFVQNIDHSVRDRSLVEAMVSLAQSLEMEVAAEFVSSKASMEILTEMGVNYLQGDFIAKAGPLEAWRQRAETQRLGIE